MHNAIKIVPALAILWLLLSGHYDALILSFGVASIALVVWLTGRMRVADQESYPFGLALRLSTAYWPWLLFEIIKSNMDVARRALGPASAVRPVVFDTHAGQQTDLGRVIHANSITLTPGTVSLEIGPDHIRVHALHPDIVTALRASGMDRRVPEAGVGR